LIMRRLSHWEYFDRPTFWGWRREWHAVYVEELPVITVEIGVHVHVALDPELYRIDREVQRLRALKQRLDAEAAVLRAQTAVLREELQLADQREPALLSYQPRMPMQKIR
jgi:hypothetical protein